MLKSRNDYDKIKCRAKERRAEDEINYGLGSIYPMPGGLKENVYWFCGEDVFIRQVEGEKRAYEFLKNYKKRIEQKKDLPLHQLVAEW